MRAKIVLSSFVVVGLMAVGGCKTKVDPGAFEAGAAATPSVEATPSAAAANDTDAAPADSSAPLAPLQTGAAPHPVAPAGGGGGGGSHAVTKPATDPPECAQARSVCGGGLSTRPTKACQDAKFACFNKGGHL